jgi:hypothetical protein
LVETGQQKRALYMKTYKFYAREVTGWGIPSRGISGLFTSVKRELSKATDILRHAYISLVTFHSFMRLYFLSLCFN